jgi:hypothetical protein
MAEHAMPKGIKRVEKGIYWTLDDRHEIRQGKVWQADVLGSRLRTLAGWRREVPTLGRGLVCGALASHSSSHFRRLCIATVWDVASPSWPVTVRLASAQAGLDARTAPRVAAG